MNEMFTQSLEELREPKVSELGGKGYSLATLLKNGFNVPKGFVVTSQAFFAFLKQNNLLEETIKLASEINRGNFLEKSKEIKDLILKGEIPEKITTEIKNQLAGLNVKAVAIRSSSASEDSLKSSFAGLHDTFLNIKTEPDSVLEAIKKCWASLFNQRAVAYRIRKGIPHLEGMAVIIQGMVPAEVSGVAFTAHPDTKETDKIVIECSWGLGEAIVAGKVTPDRYIVEKKSLRITDRKLGTKKIMVETQEKGTIEVDTPLTKRDTFCLSDTLIENLSKVCLNIEKLFSSPQDIEWCIHKDMIWVLQSRSITSLEEKHENK